MTRLLLMPMLISAMLLAGGVTGHSDRLTAERRGRTMPAKTIAEALQEHTDALMAIPGVVGVAQGLLGGKPCIRVFVLDKTPQMQQQIPGALHGYPVVVEPTGEIRALPKVP